MRSELRGKVVVITGASSGIGRATAHRFAEHGARLVVAARRVRPLDQAVRECVLLGGEATAVQVDVSNPASMESLARRAVESYGRVDIWVNNAAVSLYAGVDDGPLEVHRRVIQTNLLGYLYGARLAVRIFSRTRSWRSRQCVLCCSLCRATLYERLRRQQIRDSRPQRVHSPGSKRLSRDPRLHRAARFD